MKPLIILGAGAAHDYITQNNNTKSLQWKPPLTNKLFSVKEFEQILISYPEVVELAADAETKVPHRMSFEAYLTELRDKHAKTNSTTQKQLIALSFYLQHLFHVVSNNYGNQLLNNYKTLIGAINYNGGEACVVNFNYDSLFEQNIPNIKEQIDTYITGAIKVIKLHGSHDWVYPIMLDSFYDKTSYRFLMDNPWYLESSDFKMQELYPYRRLHDNNKYKDRYSHFYPAIAIPLNNKEKYICPENHLKYLIDTLTSTNRILIIGWRAGDKSLVDLIKKYIIRQTKVTIVSSSKKSANSIIGKLEHIPNLLLKTSSKNGFSEFLRSEELDEFFNN